MPIAAFGAYLGIWGCGLENDVYFQIGLVTLIGVAAKNAILIVEFAKVQVDAGGDVVKSAIHAAQLRFRPILMTSLAFILGMLPMVLASGPGSASRHSIGTGVFFGMIFATTLGIVMVPFFFVLIYKIKNSSLRQILKKGRSFLPVVIATVAIGIGTSSCKLGKEYSRPDLNMPETFEIAGDSATVADIAWGDLYQDTVLQKLINTALTNNKDMCAAAAKIKEMAAAKRISTANIFPTIDFRIHAENEATNYGGDNYDNDPEPGVKLNFAWELDLWGKLRWARESDIAAYMQSVEAQRALKMTIVSEVAASYFELTALDRELAIVKQTLDARKESVKLAKLRFDGGLTSETAYNQALVELARTETRVPTLEKQIQMKESDLALLLGEYPHDIPRGISLEEQSLPDILPVGLPSSLLERRPDIRAAEYELKQMNAEVGVAYTSMFPQISLTGMLGFESDQLGNLLKSPYWFGAGDLIQPLFGLFKNKARHKAAQARYEQEVYSYQKTVLTAFKEVNDAIVASRKNKEITTSWKALEASASKYLELAQLQYINGVTSYMDLLDAQRELLEAQIGLNTAVLNELLATVQLYKALGGGYTNQ